MPYLVSDISDDTELILVSAPLSNPSYPLFYDLASETVKVVSNANTTEWQVQRGAANSQAVRHGRGTNLVLNASPFGGGGVTVTVPPADPVAVTNITAAGATISEGSATLGVTTLTDPGALWEAEHEYAEGDRILVLGSVVMEAKEDGLSDTDEPEWDAVANVSDGDIAWRALGEIGDIPATIMPFGATGFAYTSISEIHGDAQERVDTHAADASAHATAISDAISAHNIASPAHGIYTGTLDPTQGAGVAASPGSLYLTNLPGANGGAVFVKTGDADTAWSQLDIVA